MGLLGYMARKTVIISCITCNKNFDIREDWKDKQKYCSKKCNGLDKRNRIQVQCSYCDIFFYKSPSKLKNSKSNLYFCCREHKDLSQRGNKIPRKNYKNGKFSYRQIAFREKEIKCEYCGYSKYKEVLDVHHKDENRKNNCIDNLVILCPTCHVEEHFLNNSGRFSSKNK